MALDGRVALEGHGREIKRVWKELCNRGDGRVMHLAELSPLMEEAVKDMSLMDLNLGLEWELLAEFRRCIHIYIWDADLDSEMRDFMRRDISEFLVGNYRDMQWKEIVQKLCTVFDWLQSLEILFADIAYEVVAKNIRQCCADGNFEVEILNDILLWTHSRILPWLDEVSIGNSLKWSIDFFIHETLGNLRIHEIFDMITVFPKSYGAIVDLSRCIAWSHAERDLISTLIEALGKRLLHSGVSTNSIILVYVRMIKTLCLLDPTGFLLNEVAEPIKLYLLGRPETIRCVVTALTNDGSNMELYDELGLELDDYRQIYFDNEYDRDNNSLSCPLDSSSKDTGALTSPLHNIRLDILGLLIRIYGNKEVFVVEFKSLLAERLLKTKDFDVDTEIKSLELLKLRFGESTMRYCDIMIRDITESRRVNTLLSHQEESGTKVNAVIFSRHFWPFSPSPEKIKLHPLLLAPLTKYAQEFAISKKPKKLIWHHHLGHADVDIILNGVERSFLDVSIIHVNLIAILVSKVESWSLNDLANASGMSPESVKKKMAFWLNKKIAIQDIDGRYHQAQVLPRGDAEGKSFAPEYEEFADEVDNSNDMDESDTGMAACNAESEERNLKSQGDIVHAQFVNTMVTNLGCMTLDAIHRNLMMFSGIMGVGYDRSIGELSSFLDQLVSIGELEVGITGEYSLATGSSMYSS